MRICVTNDDGVGTTGITTLARALRDDGHDVLVVAPKDERSGAGTALGRVVGGDVVSWHRTDADGVEVFALDAPPAMCVLAAMEGIAGARPDLVVSGINHGPNLGFAVLHSGTVGAALEDRDSWCGVIVDGHHVHPASLRVVLAAKPRGKVLLVTDAMPPVGADDPSYVLYGETITVRDGVVRNAAGSLAGSALDMATAVRNTVQWLGLPLEEAARMASTYPAEFLGIGDRCGRIAPGYQADLVAVDEQLQVVQTWIGGNASPALA